MIGRHHQHQAVAKFGQGAQRRQGNGGGSVAAGRLEQRAAAGKVEAGEIGVDAVGVPLRCDQEDRRFALRPRRQPAQRLGQHRALAGKIMELLGIVLARQRPQP